MEKRYVFDFSEAIGRGRNTVSVTAESPRDALERAARLAGVWPCRKESPGRTGWARFMEIAWLGSSIEGRVRFGLRLKGVSGFLEYEMPTPKVTDVAAMPEKPTPDKAITREPVEAISLRAACEIGLEYVAAVEEASGGWNKRDAKKDLGQIEAALNADGPGSADGEKAKLDKLSAATGIIIEVAGGIVDCVLQNTDNLVGTVEVLDYDNFKIESDTEKLVAMRLLEKLASRVREEDRDADGWQVAY